MNKVQKIDTVPNLTTREAIAAVVVFGLFFFASSLLDAPLDSPPEFSGAPSENVKAPWIFLGIQFLLRHIDPFPAGIVFPSLIVAALIGSSFLRSNWSRALFWFSVILVSALTVIGYIL